VTRLLSLSLPVVGLNVLSALSLAADTAMCGHLPNARDALASLALVAQLVMIANVAMVGLTVGSIALLARAMGADDPERARMVFAQSARTALVLALLTATVGIALARPALSFLGGTEAAVRSGFEYLVPTFAGSIFYYLALLNAAALSAVRRPAVAFVTAVVVAALNVPLSYVLIFGRFGAPALGVQGAAIATVIAQAMGVLVTYAWMSTGRAGPLRPPNVFGRIDVALVGRLFRIGAPAAIDLAIVSASFVAFVRMLAHVDPAAVGAHGIGMRVQSLAYVFGFGVSQAASAMVGTALGAHRADLARSVALAATTLSVSSMGLVGLGIVLAADPIVVWAFGSTRGTSLHGHAVEWMRILGMTMPVAGVHIALVGVLRGSGATPTSLLINALGTFVVQLPVSLVLGFAMGLGATGVWVGMPAAMFAKAVLAVRAYRQGTWARTGAHV